MCIYKITKIMKHIHIFNSLLTIKKKKQQIRKERNFSYIPKKICVYIILCLSIWQRILYTQRCNAQRRTPLVGPPRSVFATKHIKCNSFYSISLLVACVNGIRRCYYNFQPAINDCNIVKAQSEY